ncbi:hypothetical protein H1C71_035826 [Ictidomys tridecemlineatus]|nr:hypothetical protein H1C71_035826 [Ictidomys tridecemlineatus]
MVRSCLQSVSMSSPPTTRKHWPVSPELPAAEHIGHRSGGCCPGRRVRGNETESPRCGWMLAALRQGCRSGTLPTSEPLLLQAPFPLPGFSPLFFPYLSLPFVLFLLSPPPLHINSLLRSLNPPSGPSPYPKLPPLASSQYLNVAIAKGPQTAQEDL